MVGSMAGVFDPGAVEALPHLAGERRALGARVAPRGRQARMDAGGIVGVEQHEVDDIARGVAAVFGEVALVAAAAAQGRAPLLVLPAALARQERDAVADLEQARHVLGALDVARHPEQVVGGSA